MTLGFSLPERVLQLRAELTSWTLYQVEIDKYHVMFWFEAGHCLMNVAYRFEFHSADGAVEYTYDVQASGDRKFLNVDSILRRPITAVNALDEHRLALDFDSGDRLVIHDDPKARSAWFYRYQPENYSALLPWFVEDVEPEDAV